MKNFEYFVENDAGEAMQEINLNGVLILQGFVPVSEQTEMVSALRLVGAGAPFRRFETRTGKKMSVRLSSAGKFGWISDRSGYRYDAVQPDSKPWPDIPAIFTSVWKAVSECARLPECCLVNYYGEGSRMGMHQDKDEKDFSCPVVSVSLGDDALFRVGGVEKHDATRSVWLKSGDVAVIGGPARLAYHGIDRIRFGSSTLLPQSGRLNVTMRVVT